MKTKTFVSILILGAVFFLASCASLPRATEEDKNKTFTDVTYDQLFEAVKDTYRELDLMITSGSKERGDLYGITRASVAWSPGMYGEGVRLFYRHYKSIFLHSGTETKIQIEIFDKSEDGFSTLKVNKKVYDAFWGVVQENLY